MALDVDEMSALVGRALLSDGVITTWDHLVRPVLTAVGAFWARTAQGIEVEHLLSRAIAEAFTGYRQYLARPDADRPPVVLACVSYDDHTLSLEALAVALREDGHPARLLGARVPPCVLAATVRRTGSRAAFVWAQRSDEGAVAALELPPSRPAVRVVAGGPGWVGASVPAGVVVVNDLASALTALTSPVRD